MTRLQGSRIWSDERWVDHRQRISKAIRGARPFGHSTKVRIFIDPVLLQHDEVWAAAGMWNDVFPIALNDLVRASGAVVTDLKRS